MDRLQGIRNNYDGGQLAEEANSVVGSVGLLNVRQTWSLEFLEDRIG